MITPLFYGVLWVFRVDVEDAMEAGYFFRLSIISIRLLKTALRDQQSLMNICGICGE